VPIVRANRVAVRVSGGPEVFLTDQGGGIWSTTIAAPAASANGHPIDVILYNKQTQYPDGTSDPAYANGVPEPVPGASAMYVAPEGSEVSDVWLDRYVVTAGEHSSVQLYVRSTNRPTARFDNRNYNLESVTGESGLWTVTLPVPASDDLQAQFPIDIRVGQGQNQTAVSGAAVLLVRRSTFPILDVTVSDPTPTPGQHVTVSVHINEYVYGQRYHMKVTGGGGEVGNFAAVRLDTIMHTPNWRHPQDTPEYDLTTDPDYHPPTYYNYLEKQFPFVIHIGDTIWTEPGAMSGPQAANALAVRFAGDNRTFDEWVADGGGPSRRIVTIPVVEKMQSVVGTTPMRVVALAAFYVDPTSRLQQNDITGVFIEYVQPSDSISTDPPDEFAIKTVRLVPPQ
jgi:hypothetical protein